MFLGDQLADVIAQIEKGGATSSKQAGSMRIGVDALPSLPRDATDRNRTSPFAFTGNKFEFRAPGSSQSCAGVNVVLNTIVAESMDFMADQIEKFKKADFNVQLQKLLKKVISDHKAIIFNGDNYSAEWAAEAARRGLPNLRTTLEGIKPLLKKENVALFQKYGVLSKVELESRYEIFLEEYHRKLHIEGKIALEIAKSIILPVAISAFDKAAHALNQAKSAHVRIGITSLQNYTEKVGGQLDTLMGSIDGLDKALAGDHEKVIEATGALRQVVDKLEGIIDDAQWPLPKYREMLFIY